LLPKFWEYMPEISAAQAILQSLGMAAPQHNEMAALTLLALCGLKPGDDWASASRRSTTVSKGLMTFIRDHYGRAYLDFVHLNSGFSAQGK